MVESHVDSISPEVRTHGTTCSHLGCAEAWTEYSLLARVIPQWQAELPQVDLTERVLAELFPPQPVCAPNEVASTPAWQEFVSQSWSDFRSPQHRPWSIALSVAGVLLLIGTLIVSVPHSPEAEVAVQQRHNPAVAAPRQQWASQMRKPAPASEQPKIVEPPNQMPASNVAIRSVEWAQKASGVMATTIVSIPERGANWVPADAWEIEWQHKLEPLRRDAHAAWDTLLDQLPMPVQPPS